MPRSRFIGCRRAVMPRAEVLATLRIRLLDRHVGVSKANLDDVAVVILDIHRTLLPLARSVERLVERHLLALIGITLFGEGGFHRSRFWSSSMSGASSPSVAAIAAAVPRRTAFNSSFENRPIGFIASSLNWGVERT